MIIRDQTSTVTWSIEKENGEEIFLKAVKTGEGLENLSIEADEGANIMVLRKQDVASFLDILEKFIDEVGSS